jgi:hypothetical protein
MGAASTAMEAEPSGVAPSPPSAAATGYTLCGDTGAEARIARDLATIAAAVEARLGPRLRALLLVGGYARGEGSVVARRGELGPFNDYDLVAVVRGRASSLRRVLNEAGHALSLRLGVDVDLLPFSEDDLAHVPATLFWLDAALGGLLVVSGPAAILGRVRRFTARCVPLEEGGRLLANRAVGLALSNLEPAAGNEDRLARHGHKAALACGDARLLACDRYRPTHAEKLAELERLQGSPSVGTDLVSAYRDATAFRARPDLWRPPGGDLAAWYAQVRQLVARSHLDHEAWRVGAPAEPQAFARWPGRVFPDLPDVRAGAAPLAALRAAIERAAPLFPYVGHPRERLARVAVALAYGHDDPPTRAAAASLLGASDDAEDPVLHARLQALLQRGG